MQMDLGVIMKVACVLKENLFIRTEQLNSKVQLIGPSCVWGVETTVGGINIKLDMEYQ